MMTKKLILMILFVLGSFLLLMQPSLLLATPLAHNHTPTPTPAEERASVVTTEMTTTAATMEAAEPTLPEVAARLAALQAQVDALAAQVAATGDDAPSTALANRVTTAVYLLDSAGLHDLDVRLNEEGVIHPADAGQVARVARLLSTVDWPDALATEAEKLIGVLTDLTAALRADDLASAAPLATEVHEVQHAFSHAADHWVGGTLDLHGDDASHGEEANDEGHDAAETETEDGDHANNSGG